MLEPGPETHETVIDISINTDNEQDNQVASEFLNTLDIETVVRQTLLTVHVEQPVSLTLVVSGDTEIQTLNRQYRHQDKPTDVLSFPLLDEPLVNAPAEWLWQAPEDIEQDDDKEEDEQFATPLFVTPVELGTNLGDIMISWPTTLHQARQAGHSIADEFLFLLCHGVLHLVGYDDQTEAGYAEMVRLQKEILAGIERKG